MAKSASATIHELLTGDDDGNICQDIPERACRHRQANFLFHVISLSATKTGDGLADPKLVLAWLLSALGAPSTAIGVLVPVRESLALLPQLFLSARIRQLPVRKWIWAIGSLVQGVCVFGMAVVGFMFDGAEAGWTIVGLLAMFAIARSLCSVSYKDVLGKTVSETSRGKATGMAGSISAALVLLFGIIVSTGLVALTVANVSIVLIVAGGLWLGSAVCFTRIDEVPGASEGGENAIYETIGQFSLLRRDPQLLRFIAVRGLLAATALAPPFLLALAGRSDGPSLTALGPFVIASSLATILSSYIWGRFSDRSSRWVLIVSALCGAVILGLIGVFGWLVPGIGSSAFLMPAALFVLMISYRGVRVGRSVYLVDMADRETRVSYTALSNTAIGLLLVAGGGFGLVAEQFGNAVVLLIFSFMCAAAAAIAFGLEEVQ